MVLRVGKHGAVVLRGAVIGLQQAARQSFKNGRVFISSVGIPLTVMFEMSAQMNGHHHHGDCLMVLDLIS